MKMEFNLKKKETEQIFVQLAKYHNASAIFLVFYMFF